MFPLVHIAWLRRLRQTTQPHFPSTNLQNKLFPSLKHNACRPQLDTQSDHLPWLYFFLAFM